MSTIRGSDQNNYIYSASLIFVGIKIELSKHSIFKLDTEKVTEYVQAMKATRLDLKLIWSSYSGHWVKTI